MWNDHGSHLGLALKSLLFHSATKPMVTAELDIKGFSSRHRVWIMDKWWYVSEFRRNELEAPFCLQDFGLGSDLRGLPIRSPGLSFLISPLLLLKDFKIKSAASVLGDNPIAWNLVFWVTFTKKGFSKNFLLQPNCTTILFLKPSAARRMEG